jgi:hypothetical protein
MPKQLWHYHKVANPTSLSVVTCQAMIATLSQWLGSFRVELRAKGTIKDKMPLFHPYK